MDSEKIQKVRNDTLEALQLYISEKHPESPLRFAELLFTISEVQRYIFQMHTVYNYHMCLKTAICTAHMF